MSDKNVGFIDEPLAPEDYVLGSQSKLPTTILQESGDWTAHLPKKELQAARGFEPSACVSYTILNCAEILVKKIYGEERNWSDRALAKLTDTDKKGGNSFKAVADFLRNKGAVPEELWPNDANSYEEYYKELPQETLDVLHEFTDEFNFSYERVAIEDIPEGLKKGIMAISVYAWKQNNNGEFYKPQGMSDGHATTLFKYEDGVYYCFDTYDSPHIKKYISEPQVAYRFHIEKKTIPVEQITSLQNILAVLKQLLEKMKQKLNEIIEQDMKNTPKPIDNKSLVEIWAGAIQSFEGWIEGSEVNGQRYNGSKSWRNRNPGNLKHSSFYKGVIGKDKTGFAIFESDEAGMACLVDYLTRAATGKHRAYNPEMSLHEFFGVYAPDGEPIQTNYSSFVASKLAVTIETKIKTLV